MQYSHDPGRKSTLFTIADYGCAHSPNYSTSETSNRTHAIVPRGAHGRERPGAILRKSRLDFGLCGHYKWPAEEKRMHVDVRSEKCRRIRICAYDMHASMGYETPHSLHNLPVPRNRLVQALASKQHNGCPFRTGSKSDRARIARRVKEGGVVEWNTAL